MPAATAGRTLNHVAKVYDLLNPIMTFGQEGRFSNKIIRLLELKGSERVLDIGCGTGSLTIKLAGLSAMKSDSLVIGLDAAPKMIEVSRGKSKKTANIRFDLAAAENLPYENEYFDCAVSGFFFHHINFGLKKAALDEAWRVLKRNGRLIILDVDTPLNRFGAFCAWAGYFLFRQEEIRENIEGKLKEVFNLSRFRSWHRVSSYLGYISLFELVK